jgi:hypothetical protein
MAKKVYGIIPHDTSQVGYSQDTPVVDHEAMKKAMVKTIEKSRKKKKKKKGMASVTTEAVGAIQRRQQALDEASK